MSQSFKFQELRSISKKNHIKNGLISYAIYFFTALIGAGIVLLNLLVPFLIVILGPLVMLPLFFACQVAINMMREEKILTFKDFLTCFGIYFTEHFRSTYRVIKSGLISLAIFIGVLLTSILLTVICFNNTNFMNWLQLIQELQESNLSDYDVLMYIYEKYQYLINVFVICILLPACTCFTFSFIYLISRYSYSITRRISDIKHPGKYLSLVSEATIKNNRKLFLKCYWSTNFPIVILFIGGFALGGYVGSLYNMNFNSIYSFGLAIALFIAFAVYGPKYYANKEAICIYLTESYKNEQKILNSQLTDNLNNLLKKMEKEPEDTKKDSEES